MCMSVASMSQLVTHDEGRLHYRCGHRVKKDAGEPASGSFPLRVLHPYALVGAGGQALTPLHSKPLRLVVDAPPAKWAWGRELRDDDRPRLDPHGARPERAEDSRGEHWRYSSAESDAIWYRAGPYRGEPNEHTGSDQALDAAIMHAWAIGPGIAWISPGTGGDLPQRKRHVFMENKLVHGARIDFYRGTAQDDLCNKAWSNWLGRLPLYERLAGDMWSGPTQPREAPLSVACLKARGNVMEIAVGLAWAAWTDGTNLTEGNTIEWDGSKEAWVEAWTRFNVRGLAPGSP